MFISLSLKPIPIFHLTIFTDFFRQIANRFKSESCTIDLDESIGKDILNDYIYFFGDAPFSDDPNLYYFELPWSDRTSISAYSQKTFELIIPWVLEQAPEKQTNITNQLPHYRLCNDEVLLMVD